MDIAKEAIEKATSCHRNKACLQGAGSICPAIKIAGEKLLFVNKNENQNCNYYVPFGYTGFCNCPIRKEIFKKRLK